MIQVECDIDISFVVVDSIVIYCIGFFLISCVFLSNLSDEHKRST